MIKKLTLPVRIAAALIAGIAFGLICYFAHIPQLTTAYLKPLGTVFINLLKFIVVPVVLLSMIDGIVSVGDMKKVGSAGLRAVSYFMVTTAAACVIGLLVASLFNNAGLFPVFENAAGAEWTGPSGLNVTETFVSVFPDNMWKAFTNADMIQVIVISLLLGAGISAAGDRAGPVRELVRSLYAVIEKVMAFIISLSPVGVFAMTAWVVAVMGPDILGSLATVLLAAYIAYVLHAVLVYSAAVGFFSGLSPLTFFKKVSPAMIFAFTSASSAATLPVSETCARDLGASKDAASFVLPLGATVNMDGTAIYQCVAAVFLASCSGISLTPGQMALIVVTATLASVGTAGTPGAATVMLAAVLTAVGLDVNLIMIIYGIDRLFDMGRTSLNVAGDISCALYVTGREKQKASRADT